jgi:hypothetical protein
MTRMPIALAAALLIFVPTACADSAADGPDTGDLAHSAERSDLLLRVQAEGGFVPVEYMLTNMPSFSLYGDGTILTPGPQIEIYPPPALPSIDQRTVTEEGIQAILQAALDAGADGNRDLTDMGSTLITDAPDTVFTMRVEGDDTTLRVYALMELDRKPPTMDAREFEARQALQRLVEDLGTLDRWLPQGSLSEAQQYRPSGSRVFVGAYRADPDLPQSPMAWSLDRGLASFVGDAGVAGYGCGAVLDAEWTEELLPQVSRANQRTPWVSEGERYSVLFRPLLPDETGC